MSRHLSDPRRKFAQRLLSFNTLGIPWFRSLKAPQSSRQQRYQSCSNRHLEIRFRSEPPSGTTIRDRLNILYFTNNKFPFPRITSASVYMTAVEGTLSLSLPSRPDKSLGAFKSLQEAAEALPGNLRAERSNIIQKRRKLFLDAKVSPFYIGRNSFEGKC